MKRLRVSQSPPRLRPGSQPVSHKDARQDPVTLRLAAGQLLTVYLASRTPGRKYAVDRTSIADLDADTVFPAWRALGTRLFAGPVACRRHRPPATQFIPSNNDSR